MAVVDRIEDGSAVLAPLSQKGTSVVMGLDLLPPGLKDGDVLRVRIEHDPETSERMRRDIASLQSELEDC